MTDGLAVAELVEVRLDGGGGYGEVLVQEAEEAWRGRVGGLDEAGGILLGSLTVLNGDELDAVAGGEDKGFADSGLLGEGASGVCEAGGWNGEAFAHFDGRGGVVNTDQNERTLVGALIRRARGGAFGGGGWRHDGEALGGLVHGVENLCTRFAIHTTSVATRTAPER